MKAKLLPANTSRFNGNHRKEDAFRGQISVISLADKHENNRANEVVVLRFYGTSAANYAALWVLDGSGRSGTGRATGYGYHRPSAAVAEAIRNAGIELDESISGRGEEVIRCAVLAIAKALRIKRPVLVEAAP